MPRRDPTEPRVSIGVTNRQRAEAVAVASVMELRAKLGAPVRRSFFVKKADTEGATPLSQLMRSRSTGKGGGRGGPRTRLSLLLTLLWVCAKGEPETRRKYLQLAELSGCAYSGESDKIQRKKMVDGISTALRDLELRGFLEIRTDDTNNGHVIRLLHEDLTGEKYSIPSGSNGDSYVRIPESLWLSGTLADLTAPGIAMFLVVLDMSREPGQLLRISEDSVKKRYGLSNSTRRRGLAELCNLNVLRLLQEKEIDQATKRMRTKNFYSLESNFWAPRQKDLVASEAPVPEPPVQ